MKLRHIWNAGLVALCLNAGLGAQSITSPAGLLNTEGNRDHGYVLGSIPHLRWQQVDASHRGTPFPAIRNLAFRRDALLPADGQFGPRTLKGVTIVMAHSSIGTLSRDLDSNYVDPPVVVFGPADITTPDWTNVPATTPAAFDLVIPLTTPFHYNGVDDLLWEIRFHDVVPLPTSLRNFPFDFQENPGNLANVNAGGTFLGTGCLVGGHTETFVLGVEVANQGGLFRIVHSTNFGPSDETVWTMIGLSDPNLTVAGLCTEIRTDALLLQRLGNTSPTGTAPGVTFRTAHSPALVGVDLFLQAIARDPSQPGLPLALTQGVQITIPADPVLPDVAHAFAYPSPLGSYFSMVEYGGIVARFSQ